LKIQSSRFGDIEYDESRVITFTEGILGFTQYRYYILIEHETNSRFRWLHSIENGNLAFVLTDPLQVAPEYKAHVKKEDIAGLDLVSLDKAAVLCIVNIGKGCKSVTVNLLGPIIINTENMKAKQVILIESNYSIKQNIAANNQTEGGRQEKIRAQR